MAGFAPETISYIEAHGTGTPLGDPIEVEGLTQAFRQGTDRKNFCAIGSVKSNIGHLDAAAGVAGLIKTALALRHGMLPPTLHFETANPKIGFENSPFYVNAKLQEWKTQSTPRRAGVSSFGIGGTNAHVVLEETPRPVSALQNPENDKRACLLAVSAKTETALQQAKDNLARHLQAHPGIDLADVAFTLHVGRREFPCRWAAVCGSAEEATKLLADSKEKNLKRTATRENAPVVFMFPGQGAQHINMGRDLYEQGGLFRQTVDQCCDLLQGPLGLDLRAVLYPGPDALPTQQLTQTAITQPALFVIEYSLAVLWMSWGVKPQAMIGHSIGEYVAACLAGVFSLEDALKLVAARGRMMQNLPSGAMLAVRLPEEKVVDSLEKDLSLAAVNAPELCVVSGNDQAIGNLEKKLAGGGVACTRLHTSHAFHSSMMDPILESFADLVRKTPRCSPQIPYLSNVSGTWITESQAMDPEYWARHLRQTVRCSDGLAELLRDQARILLEVGPGQTLTGLAKQHPGRKMEILPSQGRANDPGSGLTSFLKAAGLLWLCGAAIDWEKFHTNEKRKRLPLPSYPFERKRFWVAPVRTPGNGETRQASEKATVDSADSAGKDSCEEIQALAAGREQPSVIGQRSGIAANIRAIFEELSGRDLSGVGDDTTFIEMGFDSLFLTQASIAMEKKLNVRVAFRDLLDSLSTFGALASHLGSSAIPAQSSVSVPAEIKSADSIAPSKHDVSPAANLKIVPLTEAQKEIWFGAQMSDEASCAFNETRLITLRGSLREKVLRNALQRLVDRHEALRTTFSPHGDTQSIHQQMHLELPLVDFSSQNSAVRTRELDSLQEKEAGSPFDLQRGPLIRGWLVRLDAGEHVLILTLHHIICDGTSWGILLNELARFYSEEIRGESAAHERILQLSEFAQEQTRQKENAERTASQAYWVNQFCEGAPILELPGDRPRPATWVFHGGRETHRIGGELATKLKAWSAKRDCTLFTTLLTGCYVLLHRLTGQDRFVVGVPIADRTLKGSDRLVGHCINFLPVPARVAKGELFSHLLRTVRSSLLEAYRHQHCTLGKLLQKLDLPRDRSRMPLVSATFNLETLRDTPVFEALESEFRLSNSTRSSFDLSLNVTDISGALEIDARYNAAVFDATTIRRWLRHFETLLGNLLDEPDQAVENIAILSAEETRRLAIEWNQARAAYPRELCVHELFEQQALKTPDAVAAVFQGQQLAYGELNSRAEKLARELNRLGVGPDVLVGLCVERSLDLAIAVLAVLKAGGAYLPLDPDYPGERLEFMMKDSRAPVLLTQASLKDSLPRCCDNAVIVCMDDLRLEAGPEPRKDYEKPRPENLAYVIYTSGSSGTPKGVAMPHRGLVNLISWQKTNSNTASKTLQLASLSFDVSFQEMFSTWCAGGTLVLVPEQLRRDPLELLDLIASEKVERLFLPFVALQQLAQVAVEQNRVPSCLREVITAGEQLRITPRIVEFFSRLTGCTLQNQYGPSETHVVSAYTLTGEPAEWPILPPIGKPVANSRIHLLDSQNQLVPLGVTGEVFIGGESLARGYLNRPELTDERFVEVPIGRDKVERLYRTGDLARRQPDGDIQFLGRGDDQVKVRGYRVEPGEIEAVLARHPGVRESAVALGDGGRLVAYVVGNTRRGELPAGELRRFLAEKLPEYMVPAAYAFLEHLPLTPSGKVNRAALSAYGGRTANETKDVVPPRNSTERTILQIWQEVLRAEGLGVTDNFFELGGHSLAMTQVLSRIREGFCAEVPMRRFFEEPTVAALAAAVPAEQNRAPETGPIKRQSRRSRAEELLKRLDQLSDSEVEALLSEEDFKEVLS